MNPDVPTVLISDDDPNVVRALSRLTRRAGLRPIEDHEGAVLDLARRERPTFILMDVNQNNVDGRDLLMSLKNDHATASIEVIMMSGSIDPWTRNECLALGALEFVSKPFPANLIPELARLFGRARAAPGDH